MRKSGKLPNLIQTANQTIVALNADTPATVTEFYRIPMNPTPAHMTRMITDLDYWAEEFNDELQDSKNGMQSYMVTRRKLEDIRNHLRASAKSNAN